MLLLTMSSVVASEQACHEENQAVQEALDAYNAKIDAGQDATAENEAMEQAQIAYSECFDREMQKMLEDWNGSEDPIPDYDTGPCDHNHPDVKPFYDAWMAKKTAGEIGNEEYKAYSDAVDRCNGLSDAAPACDDLIQNGDETGVDCGGSCTKGSETDCMDLEDNDNDCRTDCNDPDCNIYDFCITDCYNGKQEGDETGIDCGGSCALNMMETCDDGLDNDKDCLVDCADPECEGQVYGETTVAGETVKKRCESPEETCFDLFDNDLDGLADCEDPDCVNRTMVSGSDAWVEGPFCEQPEESCNDGKDNDYDGYVDCLDADCNGKQDGSWTVSQDFSFPSTADPYCTCAPLTGATDISTYGGQIDVVLIFRNYDEKNPEFTINKAMKEDADTLLMYFRETKPFEDYLNNFRFWWVRAKPYKQVNPELMCAIGDYFVYVDDTRENARPYARGDRGYVYTEWPEPLGPLFLHEFGHSFGKLSDEYVLDCGVSWADCNKYNPFARIGEVAFGGENCFRSIMFSDMELKQGVPTGNIDCKSEFSEITNGEIEKRNIQCKEGCWTDRWWRSSPVSIMAADYYVHDYLNHYPTDQRVQYGPVVEWLIEQRIKKETGVSS